VKNPRARFRPTRAVSPAYIRVMLVFRFELKWKKVVGFFLSQKDRQSEKSCSLVLFLTQ
jgi:hypothetical protein